MPQTRSQMRASKGRHPMVTSVRPSGDRRPQSNGPLPASNRKARVQQQFLAVPTTPQDTTNRAEHPPPMNHAINGIVGVLDPRRTLL